MNKLKLYTCKSGVELMESGHSFLAWEKGSDTYNYLIDVGKNNFPISVSKEFIYQRSNDENFSIMRDSDAVVIKDNINDVFDDSEIYTSKNIENSEVKSNMSLRVTPNYRDGNGIDSWKSTKNMFRKNNTSSSFFVEISSNLGNDEYNNFTSISIEEAEKLVGFLQNKINYIKGE